MGWLFIEPLSHDTQTIIPRFPQKRSIQSSGVIQRPIDVNTSDRTVFEIISLSTSTPSQSKITKSGVMVGFS